MFQCNKKKINVLKIKIASFEARSKSEMQF